MNKPNWTEIDKCGVWRVLGVTECDNCKSVTKCWGADSKLPEPELTPEQQTHWEQTLKEILHIKP